MEWCTAKEIMTRPVVSARKNASARDIALQLLSGLYSGMTVTDDEGRVAGIVTEFDLLDQIRQERDLSQLTAEDIMTRDVITVDVDTSVGDVVTTLLDRNITRLPVTEKGKVVGVIARCDMLRCSLDPAFITS
ncbi:MAG: CBS domain-containing protein [Deltaproteobacteria bacterium]|nr:CBS domain-containing protein [Deltaproteobacteria bacterium]